MQTEEERQQKNEHAKQQENRHNNGKNAGQTSLLMDIWFLLRKILLICIIAVLLLVFLFGLFRYQDISMQPEIKGGDLVFYYRLDKDYHAGDCLAYKYKNKQQIGRVVAAAGDTVDITADGLIINGLLQIEDDIKEETLPYKKGVKLPITVKKGEVFVLGDNRGSATDSRVFGVLKTKKTEGTIITIIRRRDI